MNARQKAKMYKRKYEALLHNPIKFNVEQYKIDALKFTRFYPKEFIINMKNKEHLNEILTKDIAQEFAKNLDKYIAYHIEFLPYTNEYYLMGEIKVVSRK